MSANTNPPSATFILLKPDAVARKLVGAIVAMFEDDGFVVNQLKMVRQPLKEQVEEHYKEHRGKIHFDPLVKFMCSGPVVAAVLERDDAVARAREILKTVRAKFATDERHNVCHAADSLEAAVVETTIWFIGSENSDREFEVPVGFQSLMSAAFKRTSFVMVWSVDSDERMPHVLHKSELSLRESARAIEPTDHRISDYDIQLVLDSAPKKTTTDEARAALVLHKGDVVNAVVYLNNKDTVTE